MKENHKILFEPYQLAGCTLKNRYVMAAMGTGGMVTAENTFNERGIEYYVARAKRPLGKPVIMNIHDFREDCKKRFGSPRLGRHKASLRLIYF